VTQEVADPEFERLLGYLKEQRGFDFRGYKRASLVRRVRKRMQALDIPEFPEYVEYLEVHPLEFGELFNTILINVTEFFRDPAAWETLRDEYIPHMLAEKEGDAPVRIWSAGCASGEEPYSLLIAMAEALGEDALRERVRIYATDLDDHALTQARLGKYPARALENLAPGLREKYFREQGQDWVMRPELRRLVIFGKHDLVNDAPISHLDLLSCRNTLMYFNGEAQSRVFARFHFALRDKGILFLGRAEMMRTHGHLFTPLDVKARIFGKSQRSEIRDRLVMFGRPERLDTNGAAGRRLRLRDAAFEVHPVAQILLDGQGTVVQVNQQARQLFALTESDVGRPLQDLRVSYFPVEIRSRIETAYSERAPTLVSGVEVPVANGGVITLDLQISPLLDGPAGVMGASITFVDVTRRQRLQADLQDANQELETAYEELQSTNEEMETTNEELQSTVEELETTNEELQSTNEELETMNAELQSTNEELETINQELRERTAEVNEVNDQMDAILMSLRVAVAVMDRDLLVRAWSRRAEDLWGVRSDEVVGQRLMHLDTGLPLERMKAAIRSCVKGQSSYEEAVLDAVNRRGKVIRCRVTCTPLTGSDAEIRGVVLLMEEWSAPENGSAP
jgi:two-component system CheB/CheR fusion protein